MAILAWTAISWGGRVGLLTDVDAAAVGTWLRVGGSIIIGVATAWSAWRRPAIHPTIAVVFTAWTVILWTRSLLVTWIDPPSLAFALVHTVLALVWFGLAWWVWTTRAAPAPAVPG